MATVNARRVTIKQSEDELQSFQKAQLERDDIGPILKGKKTTGEDLNGREMSSESPTLKTMWVHWESLQEKNGLLKLA